MHQPKVIAVIGLGYVGLPLAVEFGKKRKVVGFDINLARVNELRAGHDHTGELTPEELADASHLNVTSEAEALAAANIFIVTVPTPVDAHKRPDLTPLMKASETVGGAIKRGDIVIYESTVYPGATEEVCVPILERASGLAFNRDFYVGYSPERINPGDRAHRLPSIQKITSGSTSAAAEEIDSLYREIIVAGTHKAGSIRVAEAAKVIENTQRDLNIALVNELAIIFNLLGVDTEAVLQAASTKWNFIPFRPGLVGGHCIGVDPYYLTHKAEAVGYHPQVILAGRRINDGMGSYAAGRMIKAMSRLGVRVSGGRVLILGLAFKEDCSDLRNTRVIDVVRELEDYGVTVDVHDPWVSALQARTEYGLELIDCPHAGVYDGVILAVSHKQFRDAGHTAIRSYGKSDHVFFDLKSVFSVEESDLRL